MTANEKVSKKLSSKAAKQLGKYATADEAAKAKNEKLVTLLKKLNVKAISA